MKLTKEIINRAMVMSGIRPNKDNLKDFFGVIQEGMTLEEAKQAIMTEFGDDTLYNGCCRHRAGIFLSYCQKAERKRRGQ